VKHVFRVIHVSVIQEEKYSIGSEILQVISKFETFVNQNEPKIGVATCGETWRCKTGETPDYFPTDNNATVRAWEVIKGGKKVE
jgi:hypothetical protein